MRYWYWRAVNQQNAALPGASISVYTTGTTTFASLYSAPIASGGSPISNPMTADSNGLAVFSVVDGTYDFVVSSGSYTGPTITAVQVYDEASIVSQIAALSTLGGGSQTYATLASLQANLSPSALTVAIVYNDPTSSNNGVYVKVGVSGTGAWTGPISPTVSASQSFVSSYGMFAGEPVTALTADPNNNVVAISTRTQDFRHGARGLAPVGSTLLQLEASIAQTSTLGTYTGYGFPDNNIVYIILFSGQSNAEGQGNSSDKLSWPQYSGSGSFWPSIYANNALQLGTNGPRIDTRDAGTDRNPPRIPLSTTIAPLVEAANNSNQTYETAASGCANQLISAMYSATYSAVTTINAAASWTTSSTTITMYEGAEQSVSAGMGVYNYTLSSTNPTFIGTVLSYTGNTVTLSAAAAHASSGSTDTLQFFSGQFLSVLPIVVAHGSYTIAQLKRGTGTYNTLLQATRDATAAILKRGQRPVVLALDWNDVESDTSNITTPSQYAASLNGLTLAINADVKSITGQLQDVVVTATAPQNPEESVGYQNVLMGQTIAAARDSRIVLSQPTYAYRRIDNQNINAAASFSAGATSLTMSSANPGWIISGTLVYNLTTTQSVGVVSTYSGTTITLQSGSLSASSGSSDNLIFAGTNTIHYSAAGRDTYGITLGNILFQHCFGPGYVPMIPEQVYFSSSTQITIRWPRPVVVDTSNVMVTTTGLPSGGFAGLYFDDGSGSPPTITGSSINASGSGTFTGPATPNIIQNLTLSGPPTGPTCILRYALKCNAGTQVDYNCFGPITGARGWIRGAITAPFTVLSSPSPLVTVPAPRSDGGITNFYESYYPIYDWARPFIFKMT